MLIKALAPYMILLTPFIAAATAQIIKLIIKARTHKVKFRDLLNYSDMPSGHTALVVSMLTIIGLTQGATSPLFGLAFVFTILVINDAVRLRNYMGQQGAALNVLIKDLKDDDITLDHRYPHLLDKIGHKTSQVLAGMLLGIIVSLISYFIFW
jgi:uncharacterized protein